jgi:hypothetical protein
MKKSKKWKKPPYALAIPGQEPRIGIDPAPLRSLAAADFPFFKRGACRLARRGA